MKMIKLFSYSLAILCCGGMLFANPKTGEERVPVATTEMINEAIVAQEMRDLRALEMAESNGEDAQAEAMSSVPVEEISLASRAAANAAFEAPSVVNLMSQAHGSTPISYPGTYHRLVSFLDSKVCLEDGSRWNIYSGDFSETYNWLTESSLSYLDLSFGLRPDEIVVTANRDWPHYSSYRYHLTNQQTGKYVRANLSKVSSTYETRFIFSYLWLYDAYGNLFVQLTLSDGSVWNTLPVDIQCLQWIDGDVIIVGANTDQYSSIAPYTLINARTKDNGGAACVRYYQ